MGDYLIIKFDNTIEYMKIFSEDKKENTDKGTVMDLNIAANDVIESIFTTGNKDQMQLIILSTDDAGSSIIHILTWDLIKNIEFSLTQINVLEGNSPWTRIVKGHNTKYNYYCS